jgi:hypothetical protein
MRKSERVLFCVYIVTIDCRRITSYELIFITIYETNTII